MDFTYMILKDIKANYYWDSPGIVRIGKDRDIAAYLVGDCSGQCLIFCHGNGETAVTEKHWFDELSAAGISVICPEYRGYALSEGDLSENGCYEAAHAAYDFLIDEKGMRCEDIYVCGYSLGSAIAVELAATQNLAGLILQAPFLGGRRYWQEKAEMPIKDNDNDNSFPTDARLSNIHIPTLIIHGTSDEIIPFFHGKAVFNRIASNKKALVPVKKAGHCNFQIILGKKYIPILSNFILEKQLPSKPSWSCILWILHKIFGMPKW